MKIRVTAKDIKNGKRDNPSRCAVARAVRRVTGIKSISVDNFSITSNNIFSNYVDLSGKVTEFIERFDDGETVKPFTFNLSKKQVATLRGE